jgi:hypothetical protein
MAREFPTFQSHSDARCFSCSGHLRDHKSSGMPPRQGDWRATCVKCGKTTWYDLYDPNAGELSDGFTVDPNPSCKHCGKETRPCSLGDPDFHCDHCGHVQEV